MGLYIVATCVLLICIVQPSYQQDDVDAIVQCPSLRIKNLTMGCSINGTRVPCTQAPVGVRVRTVWKKRVLDDYKNVTDLVCMKSGAWEPFDDTGYQTIGTGRYKWYPKKKQVITGNECHKENAYLLIIDSQEEFDALRPFITECLKQDNDFGMYVGVHTKLKSRVFTTVLYQEFRGTPYFNWFKTEPNNEPPGEDCVMLKLPTYALYDIPCDIEHGYICKKY